MSVSCASLVNYLLWSPVIEAWDIKCLTRITWFSVTLFLQEPFSVLLVLRPKLGWHNELIKTFLCCITFKLFLSFLAFFWSQIVEYLTSSYQSLELDQVSQLSCPLRLNSVSSWYQTAEWCLSGVIFVTILFYVLAG